MDILTLILWLYLLPMMIVILPGALAFGKFDDMEGVTRTDVQIMAILPGFNIYTFQPSSLFHFSCRTLKRQTFLFITTCIVWFTKGCCHLRLSE
jgi:hypothetical protein